MKKQPELTEKTKQKFVDVFCQLYSQTPIEKISIQQIANMAGYNRSTFYQYFSDIYAVLEYVENDLLSYMSTVLQNRKSFQDINTPEDIYRLFEDKELYIRAVLGEYGNIRFLEQLKKKFFSNGFENNATGDTALTPYSYFNITFLIPFMAQQRKRLASRTTILTNTHIIHYGNRRSF